VVEIEGRQKMAKKPALVLVILLVVFGGLILLGSTDVVSVRINGHEITGPSGAIAGVWGAILAVIILFCAAILPAFVFAGVGLIVVGCFALVGTILAAVSLPCLLPLLIPVLIIWLICSLVRRSKAT
jgi:predicted exporter